MHGMELWSFHEPTETQRPAIFTSMRTFSRSCNSVFTSKCSTGSTTECNIVPMMTIPCGPQRRVFVDVTRLALEDTVSAQQRTFHPRPHGTRRLPPHRERPLTVRQVRPSEEYTPERSFRHGRHMNNPSHIGHQNPPLIRSQSPTPVTSPV